MNKKSVPKKIIKEEDYSPIKKEKNIRSYIYLFGLIIIGIAGVLIIINI